MSLARRRTFACSLALFPLVIGSAAGPARADEGRPTAAPGFGTAAALVDAEGDPGQLGDPFGAVPVQVPSLPAADPAVAALGGARGARSTAARPAAGAAAARALVPMPTVALPRMVDARPSYHGQTSCDPYAKPGARAIAALMRSTFGMGAYGIERLCAGGTSEHKEGRAVDWMLRADIPAQKAVADQATAWLVAKDGEMAKRLGVLYLIWNRKMWRSYAPERGWAPYVGDSPHTDHIHISLTWDGAMKRTSWWTGSAVGRIDLGPCRVYAGQYAPLYTGPNYQRCASNLPAPPASSYAVYTVGQKAPSIAVAQQALGVTTDGAFGSATRAALLSWQARRSVPRTGVLDKATWAKLVPNRPASPPSLPTGTVRPPDVSVKSAPVKGYTGPVKALPTRLVNRFTAYKGLRLRVGSAGTVVRVLQRALGLRATGRYDTATGRAVVALQRVTRLPQTGVTDGRTWNRVELRAFPWLGYQGVTLRQGGRGAAVVALQKALRVTADGTFGPVTSRAVIRVQQIYGLPADGVVGARTWRGIIAQGPR